MTAAPDAAGLIVCSGCGARLRSRTPPAGKVPAATAPKPAPLAGGDLREVDSVLARLDAPPKPNDTLPPGTPLKMIPRPGEAAAAAEAPTRAPAGLELLLAELKEVRRVQEEILALLRARPSEAGADAFTEAEDPFHGLEASLAAAPAPVRSGRRKTVLLIEEDGQARAAAVAALELADIPVKTAVDGNGGLAAIAMEKPDAIVLDLALTGAIGAKDVVNMIKATMEWVDIPIVLYTGVPVASQKEARTIHGADEYVLKSAGPEALVARVITLFRRK